MSSMISANEASDFLIYFCQQHGDYLTNLKLQKLLYFAQGWHLAFFKKPLFNDEIEAWVHGPVVPTVYKRFKYYKCNPIISVDINEPQLTEKIKKHLVNVFEYYGKYSAYDLERISHDAVPWINARGSLLPDKSCHTVISHSDMQEYYESLAK